MLITNSKKISEKLPKGYEKGINFWKEMFIPIVIAMSASQNVFGAISGGILAIFAGIISVLIAFLMLVILNGFASKNDVKKQKAEVKG
ncbi:MAG: malonate transporter subunit MadL, partial [Clostridia bacterium]|nr:malonate transporter subunit MadL [Clostridia bacterium]